MTNETIRCMTPDELLDDYSYAVVRFYADHRPLVSNLFSLESTAVEHADSINQHVSDPDNKYAVVRILRPAKTKTAPVPHVYRELDEARATLEDLIASVGITVDHIVQQCERLCDNNVGKSLGDMSRTQFMSYECDRAAYTELANALAFLRGATNHMSDIEVPDVPAFPNPEI